MEDINQIIIKKAAIELRKTTYELDPTEDDNELRMLFESFDGIKNWNWGLTSLERTCRDVDSIVYNNLKESKIITNE